MAYDCAPPATLPDIGLGTIPDFALPTAADLQSRVAPDLETAQWLVDWLEATGHTIVSVELHGQGEFMITWR
jgi:hypothetical protein